MSHSIRCNCFIAVVSIIHHYIFTIILRRPQGCNAARTLNYHQQNDYVNCLNTSMVPAIYLNVHRNKCAVLANFDSNRDTHESFHLARWWSDGRESPVSSGAATPAGDSNNMDVLVAASLGLGVDLENCVLGVRRTRMSKCIDDTNGDCHKSEMRLSGQTINSRILLTLCSNL